MSDTKIQLPKTALNLEIIVPGIILTSGLEFLDLGLSKYISSSIGSTQAVLLFISLSYAIGLMAVLFSRLIIDPASEFGLRALFLSQFSHSKLSDLFKKYKIDDEQKFRIDWRKEKESFRFSKQSRRWNTVYRSALRSASEKEEVKKRRSQGRIIRSLFFPLSLVLFLILKETIGSLFIMISTATSGVLLYLISLISSFVIVLFLYSYAELMNFAEAHDIYYAAKKK